MIKLCVLLGNPGKKYFSTRHNIAWQLEKYFFFSNDLQWTKKFKGQYAELRIHEGEKVYFLKPGTFMNNSGECVQAMVNFFKISIDDIIVVHDELELEYGIIGMKKGGGAGGHNGLRSIVQHLGKGDFYRFRIGISRPSRGSVSSWVLSPFSENESIVLPEYLKKAAEFFEDFLDNSRLLSITNYKKINLLS